MLLSRAMRNCAAVAFLILNATSAASDPGQQHAPLPLLTAGIESGPSEVSIPGDGARLRRSRNVQMTWTPSRSETRGASAPPARLRLNLFDQTALVAARQEIDLGIGDTPLWFGRTEADEHGYVLLVGEGESAVGKVFPPEHGLFDLVPIGSGVWALRERTDRGQPLCGVGPRDAIHAAPRVDSGIANPVETASGLRGVSSVFADVLVLYTAQARMAVGGTGPMENLIDLAIADANLAFSNSVAVMRLRTPAKIEVVYAESGNVQTDRNRLTFPGDGHLDEAQDLRAQHQCDLVALVVANYGFYCGFAWIMGPYDESFAPYGYSVTATACMSNLIFAHEIGHNLGCHHDRDNTQGGAGAFPYSYGYMTAGGHGTVMSYVGIGIPHFSNPDVLYAGHPTGVPIGQPLQAHNAQSINNNAVTVVSFMGAFTGPPGAFALLDPAAGSTTANRRPTFTWGGADEGNSYQVEIDDAPDFATPVHTPQPVAALQYTPPQGTLQPNTHYWWRVSAINPLGSSVSTPASADFFTPNNPPHAFSLLAPGPGATGVGVNPTFQWASAVDADDYEFQCDDDPAFGSPAISLASYGGTNLPWAGAPLLGLTTYYWRVSASNAVGDTQSTPQASSFETIGVPPGEFSLLAPPDGPNVTTRTPTLEWSAAVQADSYSVVLDDSSLLDSPVHSVSGIGATEYVVPSGVLISGVRYYWRAIASNETGDTVSTPATQSFGVLVPICIGDADRNGLVNFGDVVSVLSNWLASYGPASGPGDANNDLIVNFFDVQTVLANWQVVCP